jgi:hypothetical protein
LATLFTRPHVLVAVTIVGALLLSSGEASAFCRTTTCDPSTGVTCRKDDNGCVRDGTALVWNKKPIPYRFSAAGTSKVDFTQAKEVIRRAFHAWTEVQCAHGTPNLSFQELPDLPDDKPLNAKEADQPWGIYFRDASWPHNDDDESIALTNQIYGKITGTINYADIEINTAMVTFSLTDENRDATDLQAVITHEVGHYIGLAHSNDPGAIMVARYCQADNDRCKGGIDRARELGDDDIAAVCSSYPPATNPVAQPKACSESPGTPKGDIAALLGLVCVCIAVARRRWAAT